MNTCDMCGFWVNICERVKLPIGRSVLRLAPVAARRFLRISPVAAEVFGSLFLAAPISTAPTPRTFARSDLPFFGAFSSFQVAGLLGCCNRFRENQGKCNMLRFTVGLLFAETNLTLTVGAPFQRSTADQYINFFSWVTDPFLRCPMIVIHSCRRAFQVQQSG